MFKTLYQAIIAAILAADTTTALNLLQDSLPILSDPFQGPIMHAEMLYYAIKKSNLEIIQHLLNFKVDSDVSFYQYCGETPLSLSIEEGLNKDIIPTIIEKTDKNFALLMAVKLHNNKIVDLLLKKCTFKDRFLKYLGLKN